MSTPSTSRAALSFDGCGINGPDKYGSRIATFTASADRKKYGPLFAASPAMLAALQLAESCIRCHMEDCQRDGLTYASTSAQRALEATLAAIASAGGAS